MKELNRFRQFLTEEDSKNPILDKYLELKKSIDYKTVFPTDLQSFVDSLDNTEREGLENDLAEGKVLKEDYDKESLLKALGDSDDAFIQLSDGRELIIYNPNSNNDDNVDMWGDYGVFAVSKDGDEEEVLYSDIAGINL